MQKRILVVDDDDMNLMRTKRILGFDYDVFLASSLGLRPGSGEAYSTAYPHTYGIEYA